MVLFQTVPVIDPTSASPYAVASDIVYDFSGTSGPGSLRGIALDEVTNSLYVTDYGESASRIKLHGMHAVMRVSSACMTATQQMAASEIEVPHASA